jgi:DNA-binding NarL/FixJ family response regulator
MYKILLADDHAVVRRGLLEILKSRYPTADIICVNNAQEVMNKLIGQNWDLIITDIKMPGRSGLHLMVDIKKAFPKIPVLVLSAHAEEEYAIRVIKAGGSGFLNKDDAVEDMLTEAVEIILSGRKYITPGVAEKLASQLSGDQEKKPHELLSDREYEVFVAISSGESTGEIAQRLSLSPNTIGAFRRRVLDKMTLRTNADLVAYAFKNGII